MPLARPNLTQQMFGAVPLVWISRPRGCSFRPTRPSGCSAACRWSGFAIQTRPSGCSLSTDAHFCSDGYSVPLTQLMPRPIESSIPDLADVRHHAVPNLDPADVRHRAVGLDLQSRPIEYKDLQSATAMY